MNHFKELPKRRWLSFWRYVFFAPPPKSSDETLHPWRFLGSFSSCMEAADINYPVLKEETKLFQAFWKIQICFLGSPTTKKFSLVGLGILYMGSIPKASHFVWSVLDFQDACFLGCQVTILPVGQILHFGMASNFASEGDPGFSLPFFSVQRSIFLLTVRWRIF